jgi:6-pyruvoyltetrahydropterin/6-carboxytetrahydropterin synthase
MPDGSKELVHHHNWTVTASVSSVELNPTGVVMDFSRLKSSLNNILAEFVIRRGGLNNIGCFNNINPSAENVAKYIYQKLEPELPKGVKLVKIAVAEEPGCLSEFQAD